MGQSIEQTQAAIDRGNLLRAYDIAQSALQENPDSKGLQHLLVLALARMGDAARAMELSQHYRLDLSSDVDHRAIVARILKDTALATIRPEQRQVALRSAHQAYAKIYQDTDAAYPGINAATLAFLAGDLEQSATLAKSILDLTEIAEPKDFYAAATQAEALFILGQFDAANAILRRAGDMPDANAGAKSSTSKQLGLIADQAGLAPEDRMAALKPILPPSVIHFCGHIFREDRQSEKDLRKAVEEYLDKNDVGFAYGSLAAGSDIVIAETILERGGELHITLPFIKEDFVAQSIEPAGEGWLPRFERCLSDAHSVNYATEMHYVGDAEQFGYASSVAMGMAKLRAQYLGSSIEQVAVWDGITTTGPAGTCADVSRWKGRGGISTVIAADQLNREIERSEEPDQDGHKRRSVAILFTDFQGFSKLSETSLPNFWEGVMGRMAAVLDRHGHHLLTQNSWGDALHAVTDNVAAAAEIALELQDQLQGFDYALLDLKEASGMRIGLHFGPVYEVDDPITRKPNFYGTEVSRAARIEPVTPPGAVFVTEPFAAILTLESPDSFKCRYVGKVEFAKGYGAYPIYRLEGL